MSGIYALDSVGYSIKYFASKKNTCRFFSAARFLLRLFQQPKIGRKKAGLSAYPLQREGFSGATTKAVTSWDKLLCCRSQPNWCVDQPTVTLKMEANHSSNLKTDFRQN